MNPTPTPTLVCGAPTMARAHVLIVHLCPSLASRDEDSLAIALHGRGMATCEVYLQPQGPASTQAAQQDVPALASQLLQALQQCQARAGMQAVPLGLCGGRHEAAVLLALAAAHPEQLQALVLLGGELSGSQDLLAAVQAPTLMIVGPGELDVLMGNRRACATLGERARLELLCGEGHWYADDELGPRRAALAADWLSSQLLKPRPLAALPFAVAGPAAQVGPHLAQRLVPRHSEVQGLS